MGQKSKNTVILKVVKFGLILTHLKLFGGANDGDKIFILDNLCPPFKDAATGLSNGMIDFRFQCDLGFLPDAF